MKEDSYFKYKSLYYHLVLPSSVKKPQEFNNSITPINLSLNKIMGACILHYLLGDLPACTYVSLASKKILLLLILLAALQRYDYRVVSLLLIYAVSYCTVWNSVFLLTYSAREDYRKRAFYTM